ncbi:MAG: hypothetical protein ACYC3H_03520 [Bellilinea sp.]
MARGKPLLFSRKPGSAARSQRKKAAESAFHAGDLPLNPPPELKGLPDGRRAWRELMRAHDQLPGELFNQLDRGFLVGYCLARQARADAQQLAADLGREYKKSGVGFDYLLKARVELRQATRLVADLEKQIYATPKSRAGVSPESRPLTDQELIDRELNEMDRLLLDREGL